MRGWRQATALISRQGNLRHDRSVSRTAPTRLLATNSRWNVGDVVRLKDSEDPNVGTIDEIRGSGWYSIKFLPEQSAIRVRGTQLIAASLSEESAASPARTSQSRTLSFYNSSTMRDGSLPLPPTIHDFDALLQDPPKNATDAMLMAQLKHFSTVNDWVVLTDLHCSPSTLATCLQVLDTTHRLACERRAGVLFLGDFWHQRGTLRVDCLNAVLDALKSWTVPMIMIPGNHDQITLRGHEHGLTPLENAYRISNQDSLSGDNPNNNLPSSIPGILIFSHPTKFHNAFFIPHIREAAMMESVLQSPQALASNALFIHADVTGAYMNDMVQSSGGVPPSMFPANKYIYSGHFHKPHVVSKSGIRIDYLGSPYQVSLSEAQQDKALAVVSTRNGWKCVETIPMDIGRRHFRLEGMEALMECVMENELSRVGDGASRPTTVRGGDRIVCLLNKRTMINMDQAAHQRIQQFRKAGVAVEIRELTEQRHLVTGQFSGDWSQVVDLSPKATWKAYLDQEVERGAMEPGHAHDMLVTGWDLLDSLSEENDDLRSDVPHHRNELILNSVTLEGFGPFQYKQTYPLRDRGLILLRGNNQDGGADSNGSGKSLLAMSTLWCFTGSLDARPMEDSKVSDIINDECTTARVSVQGQLNGADFTIIRSKTSSKSGLTFLFDGKDVSAQSAKDTQALIEEKLGVSAQILARTMFHGQHSIDDLLEASDAKLKDELSLLVPLSIWQQATMKARKIARDASKKCDELRGMLSIRTGDLERLELKVRRMESEVEIKEQEHVALANSLSKELHDTEQPLFVDLEQLGKDVELTSKVVIGIESDIVLQRSQRQVDIQQLHGDVAEKQAMKDQHEEQVRLLERERDILRLKLKSAIDRVETIESSWKLDLSRGVVDFRMPEACPTCGQPLADGHVHESLQATVTADAETALASVQTSKTDVQSLDMNIELCQQVFADAVATLRKSQTVLAEREAYWAASLDKLEEDLRHARNNYDQKSKAFAAAAIDHQLNTRADELTARVERSKEKLQFAKDSLASLATELDDYERIVKNLKDENERQRRTEACMTELSSGLSPRGVQTFVLQNAISSLQDAAQTYLDDFSDGSQRLEIKLEMGDRISRRAFVRYADGGYRERAMASLSGGQWRRCSLALNLGFSDLVARRGQLRPSLCVMDEPLTHLDRTGRANVGHVLRDMLRRNAAGTAHSLSVSTVILILQDLAAEELEESFDSMDEVVKKDGSSLVVVDEGSSL